MSRVHTSAVKDRRCPGLIASAVARNSSDPAIPLGPILLDKGGGIRMRPMFGESEAPFFRARNH